MKIVFTGGGTGGHFYPIVAVTEQVNRIIDREKIVGAKLYYVSDSPYDKEVLVQNGLIFEKVSAGKMRTYFSWKNFSDTIKTLYGATNAIYKIFTIYPDVVFGKGGYASFPAVLAAYVLRIPVFIHESDSVPGRVNKWAGKFAKRVAISFKSAADYFPKDHVAWTGQPIRMEIEHKAEKSEALPYFKLKSDMPVIFVIGGSQGAELINNTVLDALPKLLEKYQVIHQTGVRNFKMVASRAEVVLADSPHKDRYIPISFLNPLSMKMAAGAATLIISRAGSTLFEIANWGVPAILVPFTDSSGDHSRQNAFNYAHAGACTVIEEGNMTGNILFSEIDRLVEDKAAMTQMVANAKNFSKPGAAELIAKELVNMALTHEK